MKKRGFRIGFAGTSAQHLTEKTRPWQRVADAIGRSLAGRGHTFMSGGCSEALSSTGSAIGLTGAVARAFYDSLDEKSLDCIKRRIVSYLPDPDTNYRFSQGQRLLCCELELGNRRRFWPSQADVMITLCGGQGTRDEIEGCKIHGTPVIPIGCSGGASLEHWDEIRRQGAVAYYLGAMSDQDFKRLNQGLCPEGGGEVESFAEWVVECAERVARARFELPRARTEGSGEPRVFISHGRSRVWLEVQAYVYKRLGIPCVELSQEPDRGRTIIQKLAEEAQKCSYALGIMTAEDEMMDGSVRARENVIHEIGFFAGLRGLSKICILLEEGTHIPSNLSGIVYKPFKKANIESIFADIEQELRNAGLNPKSNSSCP